MTTQLTMPQLVCNRETIDPATTGLMTDCSEILGDNDALHQHLADHGYLYLRQFHDREQIEAGRRVVINRLVAAGAMHPDFDPMEGVLAPSGRAPGFAGGVLREMFPAGWQSIHNVLYTGKLMSFFGDLLRAQIQHFDFTWMRLVGPGPATQLHADSVYMGRGTHKLFTVWTPWGDNTFDMGGLLVLDGSHKEKSLDHYRAGDVDGFCTNPIEQHSTLAKPSFEGGLSESAASLQKRCGGKWLTADFQMGDIVVFNVHLIHGGTDNQSNKVRISTDTRYQRASDEVDPRWVGQDPAGHGPMGKRGMIC